MQGQRFQTYFSRKYLFGLLGIIASFACLTGVAGEIQTRQAQQNPSIISNMTKLQTNGSAAYFSALADHAVTSSPARYTLATEATTRVLEMDASDVSAWNRLAYIDLVTHQQLTKDGLAALYKSYEVSPYGDLTMMIWRTDLGTRIWTSLPDDLQQKTLDQIPVIGKFGLSWEWRINNCKYNPWTEIYQAVCNVSPAVVRPPQNS